jgi:hypothetical protein
LIQLLRPSIHKIESIHRLWTTTARETGWAGTFSPDALCTHMKRFRWIPEEDLLTWGLAGALSLSAGLQIAYFIST